MTTIERILQTLFSDDQVASWLLNPEPIPPTSLNLDMMKRSITTDAVAIKSEDDVKRLCSTSAQEVLTGMNLSHLPDYGLSEAEKLVFVCHSNSEERAFLTMTDSRRPFSFLEPPGLAIPGVRRVIAKRFEGKLIVAIHNWLQDGRSNINLLVYTLYPSISSEKYLVLLAPYPNYRYPGMSDILEICILQEKPNCSTCLSRGLSTCICPPFTARRLVPILPTKDYKNPWGSWTFLWNVYESGFKRYFVTLANAGKNFMMSSDGIYYNRPTFPSLNDDSQMPSYCHYLKCVAPYLTDRVITWGSVVRPKIEEGGGGSASTLLHIDNNQGEDPAYNESQMRNEFGSMVRITSLPDSQNSGRHDAGPVVTPPSSGDQLSAKHSIPVESQHSPSVSRPSSGGTNPQKEHANRDSEEYIKSPGNADNDAEYMGVSESGANLCKLCGSQFSRKHDLKRHVRTRHLHQFDFRCEICGSTFDRKQTLDLHYKQVHENSGLFQCPKCESTFTTNSSRRRHLRTVHNVDMKTMPDTP
eukprot:CAMPEP_0184697352 /NCGR_PEP_ID=MMETSP0313-20130426/4338_1 /TAXON_ID=2792 /ORGANISM="Porphyridium aerugineum, Strain SAG 1380-2" /LENGTH=526 /DNA_ID=CAMNT_0027156131 /DNA_START=155 /DNA_END=1735 /DNA_ORIENTATION=-